MDIKAKITRADGEVVGLEIDAKLSTEELTAVLKNPKKWIEQWKEIYSHVGLEMEECIISHELDDGIRKINLCEKEDGDLLTSESKEKEDARNL